MSLRKIISGGQTGIDRGALDAALSHQFPCGGWCPQGRKAEDGVISDSYPLKELPGGDYDDRTLKNVEESDGTVIIYFSEIFGGTAKTYNDCQKINKPCILIDADKLNKSEAVLLLVEFINQNNIVILNVAGPRGSEAQYAYDYSFSIISSLLISVHDSLR